jgi:hypothetical protein
MLQSRTHRANVSLKTAQAPSIRLLDTTPSFQLLDNAVSPEVHKVERFGGFCADTQVEVPGQAERARDREIDPAVSNNSIDDVKARPCRDHVVSGITDARAASLRTERSSRRP